jgi:hypothetical protein
MSERDDHQPIEIDRRRALRTGAAAVAGAGVLWAAPSILSVDAASAATAAPPGPGNGNISGTVSFCQPGNPAPQGGAWNVVAAPVSPGPSSSTTTDAFGAYLLTVPAGTYNVTFTPAGGPFNGPSETVNNVVVVASATTTLDHIYQSTC